MVLVVSLVNSVSPRPHCTSAPDSHLPRSYIPHRDAQGQFSLVPPPICHSLPPPQTRVMSSTGGVLHGNVLIARTASDMWRTGGIRLYFKGLTAGLIGVFPYSAIDMSTFEGIKLAYTKWSGREPGIAGSLAFGALSGGIGATSEFDGFSYAGCSTDTRL